MNWDAIGAVGEILGAIAVLITLVYVARQLRESNTLARSASVHEVMSAYGEINAMIITNPEVAGLLARLKEPGSEFTATETVQLETFCAKKIDIYMQAEEAYLNGHMPESMFKTIKEDAVVEFEVAPGLLDHYRSVLSRYTWNGEIAQILRKLI